MSRKNTGITFEPCTLVYTLLDSNILSFDDFSLIIRSLHSYMVESIIPNAEKMNVHVKLNYQASVKNSSIKLGTLQNVIAVSKLSNYVQESEFSKLEQLRRQFGLGEPSTSKQSRAFKRLQPYHKKKTFNQKIREAVPVPTREFSESSESEQEAQ